MSTVVIADASPMLRQVLTAVLRRAGHEALTAADGLAAVRLAFREQPDAVVLGPSLPSLSAAAVRRLLLDDWRTADIPVLLLAPASDGSTEAVSLDGGPADLLAALAVVFAGPPRRPRPAGVDRDVTALLLAAGRAGDRAALGHAAASALDAPPPAAGAAESVLGVVRAFVTYDAAALLLFLSSPVLHTVGPSAAADVLAARCRAVHRAVTGTLLGDVERMSGERISGERISGDRITVDSGGDSGGEAPLRSLLAMALRDPARDPAGDPVAVLALGDHRLGAYDHAAREALGVLAPRLAARIQRRPADSSATIGQPTRG